MGRQFANDSMTPSPISVSRDSYKNEIPSDKPMHDNATAGMGSFSWDSNHYSDDWDGGNKSYGVAVNSGPKVSGQQISGDKADRGKES